ncbi:hypothetical protein C0993_009065 [Termitomyces sp. T159_Od127]|nr:hypothetical protein C0993_009065 [Termitomyces sp. T159_Od127]
MSITGDVRHKATASAGPVRCAAVDQGFRYLATAGDDKTLKLWQIDGLKLVNERDLPKRPTAILFTADAQTILVADKFGDVYALEYEYVPPAAAKQPKDALSSHENPSGGTLVLGHTSLLTALLLSRDEQHIITADRDEHVRVSRFPQGFVIEAYCLGHTKFVSGIHTPAFAPAELVSGGGDAVLMVWDWMAGSVKSEIPVWDAVEPYMRVRGSKRRRGADGEGASEGGRRGRGRKTKGSARAKEGAGAGETTENAPAAAVETQEEKTEKVLVVQKIETTASRRIVFSVVGATALFAVDYPGDGAPAGIRPLDLGHPVLDFVVAHDDRIWVALDGNWADGTAPADKCYLTVLEISESGELSKSTSESPVVRALNSTALLPATEDDLKKLELYNDLVAMPKGYEGENDPDGDTAPAEQSKRILGRLKNKEKVLQKERELAGAVDDGIQEPEVKKARPDAGQDVDMAQAQ